MSSWVPLACWPLIVVIALGGAALGGAIAVTAVFAAIAAGVVLVYLAS